jgi:hypothetical protein
MPPFRLTTTLLAWLVFALAIAFVIYVLWRI